MIHIHFQTIKEFVQLLNNPNSFKFIENWKYPKKL